MANLIFSRDGVLRLRFFAHDRLGSEHISRLIPLRAWEAAVDERILLKSLNSDIVLEEGITVGEMMENLSPWADLMTGIGCMDFPAFLEESRRGGDKVKDIDRVEIRYTASIEAVPRFERRKPVPDSKDFRYHMGIGKPMRTDRVSLEARWDCAALLTEEGKAEYGGEESVSLSFTPVSEYAHLPLVISREGTLYDQAPYGAEYLGTSLPLLSPDHPLTHEVKGTRVRAMRMPITAPSPTLFDTLVMGFLWEMGFDYSPAQRDASGESVMRSVEALKSGESTPEPEEDNADFLANVVRLRRAEEAAADLGLTITEPRKSNEEDEG